MTIRQFTVDNTTWTRIVVPVDCSSVTLADAGAATAIKLRSDPADATTEKSVAAVAQPYSITSRPVGSARSVYATGVTAIFAQAAAGTITVVATFV